MINVFHMNQAQQNEVLAMLNKKLPEHQNKAAVCNQIVNLLTLEGCNITMCSYQIRSICNTDEEANGVIDALIQLVDHMVNVRNVQRTQIKLENDNGQSDRRNDSNIGVKRPFSHENTQSVIISNTPGGRRNSLQSPARKRRKLNGNLLKDERSQLVSQQASTNGYVLYQFILESLNAHCIEMHTPFISLAISVRCQWASTRTAVTTKQMPKREGMYRQRAIIRNKRWRQRLSPMWLMLLLLCQPLTNLLQRMWYVPSYNLASEEPRPIDMCFRWT